MGMEQEKVKFATSYWSGAKVDWNSTKGLTEFILVTEKHSFVIFQLACLLTSAHQLTHTHTTAPHRACTKMLACQLTFTPPTHTHPHTVTAPHWACTRMLACQLTFTPTHSYTHTHSHSHSPTPSTHRVTSSPSAGMGARSCMYCSPCRALFCSPCIIWCVILYHVLLTVRALFCSPCYSYRGCFFNSNCACRLPHACDRCALLIVMNAYFLALESPHSEPCILFLVCYL